MLYKWPGSNEEYFYIWNNMNIGVHENVLNDCESKSHVFTAHAAHIQHPLLFLEVGEIVFCKECKS